LGRRIGSVYLITQTLEWYQRKFMKLVVSGLGSSSVHVVEAEQSTFSRWFCHHENSLRTPTNELKTTLSFFLIAANVARQLGMYGCRNNSNWKFVGISYWFAGPAGSPNAYFSGCYAVRFLN